jgi:hypothetical protein
MLLAARLGALATVLALSACGAVPAKGPDGATAPPSGERITLAAYAVGDRHFSLVSFRDPSAAVCVTVDEGRTPGVPACAIPLSGSPVNAAIAGLGGGVIAVYGRAADDVTRLEALTEDLRTAGVAIYHDPSSGQRFFADLIEGRKPPQLTAVTAGGRQVLTDLNTKIAAFYR